MRTKLAIFGPERSGKTSICERLEKNKFSDEYRPNPYPVSFQTDSFKIWDFPGQLKYLPLLPMYLGDAIGLFVMDGTKSIEQNKIDTMNVLEDLERCGIDILGLYVIVSKGDSVVEDAAAFGNLANEIFSGFIYLGVCSAKNAINIKEAFSKIKAHEKTDFKAHIQIKFSEEKPDSSPPVLGTSTMESAETAIESVPVSIEIVHSRRPLIPLKSALIKREATNNSETGAQKTNKTVSFHSSTIFKNSEKQDKDPVEESDAGPSFGVN